jgi:hypothetical protein
MSEQKRKSILQKNSDVRKKTISSNNGEYEFFEYNTDEIVGGVYAVRDDNTLPEQHDNILSYTHSENNQYSQNLHENYGIGEASIKYYTQQEVKPSQQVKEYDGFGDYITYVNDVYGRDESYAGHIMGLLDVRDLINDSHYDTIYSKGAKTFADTIDEIVRYYSTSINMAERSVGIVKNIDVAKAINGVVTTNINNYDNKETKLGMISNRLYALSLLNAAQINTFRRPKYLTPSMEGVYGNNMSNIYRLSSLFLMDDATGRMNVGGEEIRISDVQENDVYEYLSNINPEFNLPDVDYYKTVTRYGFNDKYFGLTKLPQTGEYQTDIKESTIVTERNDEIKPNWGSIHAKVYSEGNFVGNDITTFTNGEYVNNFIATPFDEINEDTLLSKTNKFLKERRVRTILSRFYDETNVEKDLTQSAVSKFGVSHGRNLLTKEAFETGVNSVKENGYDNPYCRVWTNHHQFSKLKHMVRPFYDTESDKFIDVNELQSEWNEFRTKYGAKILAQNGVINKNGFVNITPTKVKSGEASVDIKQCMFSIENLAWKDVLGDEIGKYRKQDGELYDDKEPKLSAEQRGPNGGRIMWFPPYDLTFQETAKAQWSSTDFIGRGEPVYTYTNSSRSGTLEFTLLVDNPSVLNYWMMTKNNSEENEQSLLRHFAGCQPLEMGEDNSTKNDNDNERASHDPMEDFEGRDINFYVFFPNNYSGKSIDSPWMELFKYGGEAFEKDKNEDSIVPLIFDKYFVEASNNAVTIEGKYQEGSTLVDLKCVEKDDPSEMISSIEINNDEKGFLITFEPNNSEEVRIAEVKFCAKSNEGDEYHETVMFAQADKDGKVTTHPSTNPIVERYGLKNKSLDYNFGYEMGASPVGLRVIYDSYDVATTEYELNEIYTLTTAINEKGVNPFDENIAISYDYSLEKTNNQWDGEKMEEFFRNVNTVVFDKSIGNTEDSERDVDTLNNTVLDIEQEIANFTNDILAIENQIAEVESSIERSENEIDELNRKKEELLDDIYATGDNEAKQEELEQLNSQISNTITEIDQQTRKKETLETEKSKLENEKVNAELRKQQTSEEINKIQNHINDNNAAKEYIVDRLEPASVLRTTQPLYFYKKGDNYEFTTNIKEPLIYMDVNNTKKYPVKDLEIIPSEFIKDFSCKIGKTFIKGSDEYKFVTKDYKSNTEIFQEFETKTIFLKSIYKFGKDKSGSKYWVKTKNSIKTFNNRDEAEAYIKSKGLIGVYKSTNDIRKAQEIYGIINEVYYVLLGEFITEEKVREEVQTYYDKEDEQHLFEVHYKNRSLLFDKPIGTHGMIQYFWNGKKTGSIGEYNTVQECINRSDVLSALVSEYGVDENGETTEEIVSKRGAVMSTSNMLANTQSENETKTPQLVEASLSFDFTDRNYHHVHDADTEDQKANLDISNLYDTNSFGLNSTLEVVKTEMNDDSVTFSFGEVCAAAIAEETEWESYKEHIISCETFFLERKYSDKDELKEKIAEVGLRLDYLRKVFHSSSEADNVTITRITTNGNATVQGNDNKNKSLSKNRKETINEMLETFFGEKIGEITIEQETVDNSSVEGEDNVSSLKSKKGRYSKVKIIIGESDDVNNDEIGDTMIINDENGTKKRIVYKRYDDERRFFSMLEKNDNVAYKRLVDKVKYFSPAFHSITPEGFNARLTFLHQCTRQGPTTTVADMTEQTTASNLAFGRAPFCILRLGDFLNTKIVIESVNITYPDTMWDINPEGIGAQFMLAKVVMSINILGGSDITAPIKRLQNAVSFNYYANTSVYDNRSDRAEYTSGNTITDIKQWFA